MMPTWKIYIDGGRHPDDVNYSAKQMRRKYHEHGRRRLERHRQIPIWFYHGDRGDVWLDWSGTGTCGVGTARI